MSVQRAIEHKTLLERIVKEDLLSAFDAEENLIKILDDSDTAEFYNEQFKDSETVVRPAEMGESHEDDVQLSEIPMLLAKMLNKDAVVLEIGGSVYQRRSGNMYKIFKNYLPLDISHSSMLRYANKYDRIGIVANAEAIPLKDSSVDAVYTHAFLEHPRRPDLALEEIARILKPGGIVIHKDAWFSRWWHRYGIVGVKTFWDMTWREKLIFLAAKFTELPPLRYPPAIIKRWYKETFKKLDKPIPFDFNKLDPNYELMLASDEDAASSIDPLDVIRFYESRGFYHLPKLSKRERLLYRMPFILVRKKFVDDLSKNASTTTVSE